MIFTAARLALADIFSPPFRAALWKTLGLTAVVLVALWFGIGAIAEIFAVPFLSNIFPDDLSWLDQAGTLAGWAAGGARAATRSHTQIADLLTYLRNTGDRQSGAVSAEAVAEMRKYLAEEY